jgi:hypothetical protein
MPSDVIGRYSIFAAVEPDKDNTVNIKNCTFHMSAAGGLHIYINQPNTGSTVNIDGCTFDRAAHMIDIYNGTLNVTRSVFKELGAGCFAFQIYPYHPTVNISYCTFWRIPPGAIWIWIASANDTPVVKIDHCDVDGEGNFWDSPLVQVGNNTKANVTVTNCNIGTATHLSSSGVASGFSGTYSYNNFFRFAKNVGPAGVWTDGGHNLTVDAGTAATPDFAAPPTDWTYTASALLTADSAGGPLGSGVNPDSLVPVELSLFAAE